MQLLVLGTPILVIAYDDVTTFYIVASLVLFLSSFGTSVLIYAPKANALRTRQQSGETGMSNIMMAARKPSNTYNRQGSSGSAEYNRQGSMGSVEEIRLRASLKESARMSQASAVSQEEKSGEPSLKTSA